MAKTIGITLGDVTGVGPEVTLKAIAAEADADDTRYVLVGDGGVLDRVNSQLGLRLPLEPFSASAKGRFLLLETLPAPLPEKLVAGSPVAAQAAVSWLREAAERCLRKELVAMVTAPVNKESIIHSGQPFVGQTEFLSALAGTDRTAMMLLGHDDRGSWLRVVLATTHVPIRMVANAVTQAKVELAIECAHQACKDLGLPRARIAVCGLNPHAGEGGEIGTEEITTIAPAVRAARARGRDVTGPTGADALFHYVFKGDYEVVVAMYHDQGLGPLKMIGFETGINWTLGLPFIRTSPDHGTAYDIAGRGIANPGSMISAVRLAKQLASNF